MTNFLEQLVAEWYEFQGYFVRRNVLMGKRAKGGYECELEIVAFHPTGKRLVQVEPSMDADSWEVRERRYHRKFEAGKKHIPDIFKGLNASPSIDQVALLGFASSKTSAVCSG